MQQSRSDGVPMPNVGIHRALRRSGGDTAHHQVSRYLPCFYSRRKVYAETPVTVLNLISLSVTSRSNRPMNACT